MTIEEYNTATGIIAEMQALDNSIYEIENIIQTSDTKKWMMEIRPNRSYPLKEIDHKGLLPEFLNTVLDKLCEERAELEKALEEI